MKLNLSKCEGFTTHRSGWSYAIKSLMPFHSESGIFFDDFVERKFIWNRKNKTYYDFPWIGVIHVPKHDRGEFDRRNSFDFLYSQPNFQKSLKYCLCLITLSEDLRKCLPDDIPSVSIKHPTELAPQWRPEDFLAEPSITQLGYWLRDLISFGVDIENIKKTIPQINTYCMPGDLRQYADSWNHLMRNAGKDYVVHDPIRLDNREFDNHMTKTLVWCRLHATSANNGIIEPLIRNTPILTNRLPAVEEYLGEDYPLYIEDNDTITIDKILKAHYYLKNKSKIDLSGRYFASHLILKLKEKIFPLRY